MRTSLGWLALSALVFSFTFPGENPVQKKVIDRLAAYNRILPQEKVYLHFDKPYYHPGDTLWLKAYLVDAMNHLPDSASKVLYVDFLDLDHGKLILTKMLKADNGFAQGNIDLGDSLTQGNYQVRSYTNWMRNFPESFFFKKDIRLYKKSGPSHTDEMVVKLSMVADLQFFPEGGNLINDIANRVAFKAVNIAGRGIDVQGFILKNKKDTVTTFKSSHLGMGYFIFKPSGNETYTAFVKDLKGAVKSYSLPASINEGFAMGVDNISRKEEIRIIISHTFQEKKDITLIAHQRGKICYAANAQVSKGSFQIRVPRESFSKDGIAHFTLFDQDGVPRCERLAYINKGVPLQVGIKTNKTSYQAREKVEVEIQIKDAYGDPVQGNFSLVATDENQVLHEPYAENIQTYFLLSADVADRREGSSQEVKGIIEQPDYYFDKNNNKAAADLDVLLMTQGWRRFLWDDVLNKTSYDTAYAIEQGLQVSGRVTERSGQVAKQPVTLSLVLSSAKRSNNNYLATQADADGRFIFSNLNFFDSAKFVVQGEKANKGKKLKFTFDSFSAPPVKSIRNPDETTWIESSMAEDYIQRERQYAQIQSTKSRMLSEVVVSAEKYKKLDSRKTMLGVAQKSNTVVITSAMCAGAINVFQLLQSKISSLRVMRYPDGYHVQIRSSTSFNASTEPLYLVDGVPTDASYINSLTPCEIETIEVFKSPGNIYGTRGVNGIIAFYTRLKGGKEDLVPDKTSPDLARLIRVGYSTPREFYSPRYDQNSSTTVPDYRSTLYWMPELNTNEDGKATVVFWNSDERSTDVKIILEGLSFSGKVAVASATYSVN